MQIKRSNYEKFNGELLLDLLLKCFSSCLEDRLQWMIIVLLVLCLAEVGSVGIRVYDERQKVLMSILYGVVGFGTNLNLGLVYGEPYWSVPYFVTLLRWTGGNGVNELVRCCCYQSSGWIGLNLNLGTQSVNAHGLIRR